MTGIAVAALVVSLLALVASLQAMRIASQTLKASRDFAAAASGAVGALAQGHLANTELLRQMGQAGQLAEEIMHPHRAKPKH